MKIYWNRIRLNPIWFALFTVKAKKKKLGEKNLKFSAVHCKMKIRTHTKEIHNKAPFVDIMNSVFNNALIVQFKRWFYFLFSKILNSICIGCWFLAMSRATFPLKIHVIYTYANTMCSSYSHVCVLYAMCEFLQEKKWTKCLWAT